MSHIPAGVRRAVLERAGGRCEYCQLAQAGQEATRPHVVRLRRSGAPGVAVELVQSSGLSGSGRPRLASWLLALEVHASGRRWEADVFVTTPTVVRTNLDGGTLIRFNHKARVYDGYVVAVAGLHLATPRS